MLTPRDRPAVPLSDEVGLFQLITTEFTPQLAGFFKFKTCTDGEIQSIE